METETESERTLGHFDHKNNITSGIARVIWATACCPIRGSEQPDGWVLPGGRRTQDRAEAAAVAMTMDWLMSGRAT